jgi:hypothetical protein
MEEKTITDSDLSNEINVNIKSEKQLHEKNLLEKKKLILEIKNGLGKEIKEKAGKITIEKPTLLKRFKKFLINLFKTL